MPIVNSISYSSSTVKSHPIHGMNKKKHAHNLGNIVSSLRSTMGEGELKRVAPLKLACTKGFANGALQVSRYRSRRQLNIDELVALEKWISSSLAGDDEQHNSHIIW